jgi:hypothetical protein
MYLEVCIEWQGTCHVLIGKWLGNRRQFWWVNTCYTPITEWNCSSSCNEADIMWLLKWNAMLVWKVLVREWKEILFYFFFFFCRCGTEAGTCHNRWTSLKQWIEDAGDSDGDNNDEDDDDHATSEHLVSLSGPSQIGHELSCSL